MLNDARFRFFQTTLKNDEKKVAALFILEGVLTLLLLINVIYLNINLFQKSESAKSNATTTAGTPTLGPSQQLYESEKEHPPIPTIIPTSVVTSEGSPVKDYFIPLGSGTSTASDWTDVPGAQATVDFGSYKNIKSIVFETSVAVPTANQSVSVRLYNTSDKHPVWYSEVTMEGGTSAYLISNPIAYDKGSKIYQVQMKTQLQYPANLTQARIHITLQ
jgi:hypothetical protein